MDDSPWWTGVLGGTAAWLLLYSRPALAELGSRNLLLPLLLALGPFVAASIYMDFRGLSDDHLEWQPRIRLYVAAAVVFPAVVGPLYLFFRFLYVELQVDEAEEGSRDVDDDLPSDPDEDES